MCNQSFPLHSYRDACEKIASSCHDWIRGRFPTDCGVQGESEEWKPCTGQVGNVVWTHTNSLPSSQSLQTIIVVKFQENSSSFCLVLHVILFGNPIYCIRLGYNLNTNYTYMAVFVYLMLRNGIIKCSHQFIFCAISPTQGHRTQGRDGPWRRKATVLPTKTLYLSDIMLSGVT